MAGPVPGPYYPPPPHRRGGFGRVLAKLAWCAVPVLTLGLFGFLPSLVLAMRLRRVRDWIFAVFFLCATVGEWAVAAEGSTRSAAGQELAFGFFLLINVCGALIHFLLTDRVVRYPPTGYPAPQPYAPAGPTVHGLAAGPYPVAPQPRGYPPQGPQPARSHQEADQVRAELEELSELLRRSPSGEGAGRSRDAAEGGGRDRGTREGHPPAAGSR